MSASGLTWEWDGPRRWLDADERGSIVRVTNDAGTVLAVNRYDEFGIPAAGNMGRFQYTGQMWMPELGLYYYKARMYSPTLGRFLQTDPIGYGDGLNWYDYVGGDPVNATDPSGLALYPGTFTCPAAYVQWVRGSCYRKVSASFENSPGRPSFVFVESARLDCGGKGIPAGYGMCDDGKRSGPTSGSMGGAQAWPTTPAAVPQNEQPAKQCAAKPRFGVPDGYRAYDARGRTMTKVGDSSGKVYLNPAYRGFVADSHTTYWASRRTSSSSPSGRFPAGWAWCHLEQQLERP